MFDEYGFDRGGVKALGLCTAELCILARPGLVYGLIKSFEGCAWTESVLLTYGFVRETAADASGIRWLIGAGSLSTAALVVEESGCLGTTQLREDEGWLCVNCCSATSMSDECNDDRALEGGAVSNVLATVVVSFGLTCDWCVWLVAAIVVKVEYGVVSTSRLGASPSSF